MQTHRPSIVSAGARYAAALIADVLSTARRTCSMTLLGGDLLNTLKSNHLSKIAASSGKCESKPRASIGRQIGNDQHPHPAVRPAALSAGSARRFRSLERMRQMPTIHNRGGR